jgi:hypothetical protein
MAYKQNNPLSRKPSPLNDIKIDSRNGQPYAHRHGYGSKENTFRGVQGKVIRGNPNFNTNVNRNYREDGNKVNARGMNLEYLQNIANIYNQGGFAPGSTFSGGTYYNQPNSNSSDSFLNKLTGLRTKVTTKGSTGVPDDFVIEKIGRSKGIQGQGMHGLGDNWVMNEETGGYDFTGDPSTLTAPDQQYTGEQLYDIMSGGDGVMQYIEGIGFVSGNQAGTRRDLGNRDNYGNINDYHHGFNSSSRDWEYTDDSNSFHTGENMPWLVNEADYDPNKPYDPNAVVEEVVEEPVKPQVPEDPRALRERMMEERKQKILASRAEANGVSRRSSNEVPFYRRSSKSSPLNQVDPRTGPLEGYEYGEGVVGEKVPVYDDAGQLIGYNTPTDFSGTKLVPGTEGVPGGLVPVDGVIPVNSGTPGTPGGDPVSDIDYFESFNNKKNIGEGFDPGWDPTDPVDLQAFKDWRTFMNTAPVAAVEDQTLSDQYTTTAFEPYEEEIIEEKPPAFSIGTKSTGSRTGGKLKIGVPDISLPSITLPSLGKKPCYGCPTYSQSKG